MMLNKNTELRKLPAGYLSSVEEILEINEDWKRFMCLIPDELQHMDDENYEKKYNTEDIRLIENHALDTKVKCAKVLFVEWGTSGRVRPTLSSLKKLLEKAQIYRAADEIADMLDEPRAQRPTDGPAAHIDLNVTSLLNNESVEQKLNSMDSLTSDHFEGSTHANICNDVTKQMKSLNLIEFSTKNVANDDLQSFQQTTTQTQSTNLIKFSKDISKAMTSSNSQYLPDFNILNPQTHNIGSYTTNSMPETSTDISDTSQTTPSQSNSFQIQSSSLYDQIDIGILEDTNLIQFEYKELEAITNGFSDTHIGSGGFGDVFVGNHLKYGQLAVKKANNQQITNNESNMVKIFNREVKSLSLLRHTNIVPILGFSLNGPAPCIICEYIDGGSLKQKIAEKVLNESQRIHIMIGTAEGLKYIHNSEKPSANMPQARKAYFLHGDVKSANILLTKECVPKLCDFGLSKQFDITFVTTSIMGTTAYMAPESFSGTITQKSDVYSYGIVLLELLTGLEPIVNDNNSQMNIKDYLEDYCEDDDISQFLDSSVDRWKHANYIYDIAKLCLNSLKTQRPSMDEICKALHKIHVSYELQM